MLAMIGGNCVAATLGPWWIRPMALFVALFVMHILTIFMTVWREQHRQAQQRQFMEWVMAQATGPDDDDDEPVGPVH